MLHGPEGTLAVAARSSSPHSVEVAEKFYVDVARGIRRTARSLEAADADRGADQEGARVGDVRAGGVEGGVATGWTPPGCAAPLTPDEY
jgi:hypothetical protein